MSQRSVYYACAWLCHSVVAGFSSRPPDCSPESEVPVIVNVLCVPVGGHLTCFWCESN